ncbi:MAG: hypothetical protein Q6354_05740 [Candidatus Brocadiales bacterium]|nr:hypothetical protein [Candidatus Brocadiales bacterium]
MAWWAPWTWIRRRGPEEGEGEYLPEEPEEEGFLREEFPQPEMERKRPSKEVLVEEVPEEAPPEEEYWGGVYISDRKVKGGFKKFWLSIFSIFLLPFILVFGISLATCVFLLVFPLAMSFFPIFLIGLFMLFIIAPVAVPLIIVYLLATERGRLLINSKGSRFSLHVGVPPEEE